MTAATSEPYNLRASITRLAQFRPGAGQLQIEAVVRELMLTSAYEAGGTGIEALTGSVTLASRCGGSRLR